MPVSKKEKKELDRLLREACFARDKNRCQVCGKTETLAPSHIYPKGRYRRMRWDIDNVITFCFYHHIGWWHKNPIEAHEWLQEFLPKERLKALKLRSDTCSGQKMDYELIRLDLEQTLKKLMSV